MVQLYFSLFVFFAANCMTESGSDVCNYAAKYRYHFRCKAAYAESGIKTAYYLVSDDKFDYNTADIAEKIVYTACNECNGSYQSGD